MCITVIKILAMISFVPSHVNRILLFLFTNKPYKGIRCSLGEDVMELSHLCTLQCQSDAWMPGWRGPLFLEWLVPSVVARRSGVITHWIPDPVLSIFILSGVHVPS